MIGAHRRCLGSSLGTGVIQPLCHLANLGQPIVRAQTVEKNEGPLLRSDAAKLRGETIKPELDQRDAFARKSGLHTDE